MRTTVTVDDKLIADAMRLTGIKDRATLIRTAVIRMVQHEAALALAAMGGTDPTATAGRRRRFEDEE